MLFSTIVRRLSATFLRRSFASRTIILSYASPTLISPLRSYSTTPDGSNRLPPEFRKKDDSWEFFADFSPTGIPPEPIKKTPEEIWQINSKRALDDLADSPPASTYRGRSIRVVNGNIGDAYRKLDIRLAQNRVRYELKLTERHEKKGIKRRRLSSERWRKRFADEVRKKVALVKAIRRRGS